MIMDQWTPQTAGAGFEFTPILKPLEPFRDSLIVVSNLDRPEPSDGSHATAPAAWLTGVVAEADRRRGRPRRHDASIRWSRSRSGRTRRSRRSSSRPRISPGYVGACDRRLQLRLHEHDLVADADHAAADGDQPARRLRADVRRPGTARRSGWRACGRPQHPRFGHGGPGRSAARPRAARSRAARRVSRQRPRDRAAHPAGRAAGTHRARPCPTRRSACPTRSRSTSG